MRLPFGCGLSAWAMNQVHKYRLTVCCHYAFPLRPCGAPTQKFSVVQVQVLPGADPGHRGCEVVATSGQPFALWNRAVKDFMPIIGGPK